MLNFVNLTKKKEPALPWKIAKEKILGKNFSLSIILAGNKLMAELNGAYRGKKTAANTLSFKMEKKYGEIFLNLKNSPKKLFFLFIHSLLHIKGMEHGKKMEETEQKYFKKIFYGVK